MKVLLTGSAGQLGEALLACAPASMQITAIVRADLDLANNAAVHEKVLAIAPDLVINTAAYNAVDRAEDEEEIALAVNSRAVAAMASALDKTGGRLVHVSTDYVFDGDQPRAYMPEDARNPLSAYGRSKAGGEDALRPSDLLVRTSWVHTAGHANFVRAILRLMRERDQLGVVCDQIGSPTWAPGLARVLWKLVELGGTGPFHHSDAGVASRYDFAMAIQEEALALGLLTKRVPITPIPTSVHPTPAVRPGLSVLDCSATRELLEDGYTHWRVNLRRMLEEEAALG